jgi:hypothetical protein
LDLYHALVVVQVVVNLHLLVVVKMVDLVVDLDMEIP